MKYKTTVIISFLIMMQAARPAYCQTFANQSEALKFFEKLDDEYNQAMVGKDSMVFERHLATTYINCTPQGNLNNKINEIKTLLLLPLLKVERTAPEFTIFSYSGDLASFSVVKKLTDKMNVVAYVRRTTIYKIVNGRWQGISGQGTILPFSSLEPK